MVTVTLVVIWVITPEEAVGITVEDGRTSSGRRTETHSSVIVQEEHRQRQLEHLQGRQLKQERHLQLLQRRQLPQAHTSPL